MGNPALDRYIENIKMNAPTTSASMGEKDIFYVLSSVFRRDILSFESLEASPIHSVFVYDIPEGKKEFNIETVRKCIKDTELKPYEGKYIFVLRHFDTASLSAMNATLKLLEDTPPYAVILLEVESAKSLLDTIRSRVLELGEEEKEIILDDETQDLLQDFDPKKNIDWLVHLYSANYSRNEAIKILSYVYEKYDFEGQKKCQEAISNLCNSNESVKNILDSFFL